MDPSRPDPSLEIRRSSGAGVEALEDGLWRLSIPAGPAGVYRLAQLDDYLTRPRRRFPWRAPFRLRLMARCSQPDLPGTWGFGLWNDPFSLNLGLGGAARRLPAAPNTAWFFYAAPPNYLSLRDDLPAQGFLAATFRSPAWVSKGPPASHDFPSGPARSPLPTWAGRGLRRLGRAFIAQSAAQLIVDPVDWHTYEIDWQPSRVAFAVDGETILDTPVAPRGPLGLVLWIDNQYAAFPPSGALIFGNSPSPQPAWLEIKDLSLG